MCGTCTQQRPSGPPRAPPDLACRRHSKAQRCGGGFVRRGLRVLNAINRTAASIEVQLTFLYGGACLSLPDVCGKESNASLAPHVGWTPGWKVGSTRRRGVEASPKVGNAVCVRKAASEPRSAFPVEYRRAHFGVHDPFTRRKCSVEWGPYSLLGRTCSLSGRMIFTVRSDVFTVRSGATKGASQRLRFKQ
eukprot:356735-Chlamydomonas_euryale.AAC.2